MIETPHCADTQLSRYSVVCEKRVTVLLCLPLLVAVGHLRAGLLHVLHGCGASVRHTGAGGHGPHPQHG